MGTPSATAGTGWDDCARPPRRTNTDPPACRGRISVARPLASVTAATSGEPSSSTATTVSPANGWRSSFPPPRPTSGCRRPWTAVRRGGREARSSIVGAPPRRTLASRGRCVRCVAGGVDGGQRLVARRRLGRPPDPRPRRERAREGEEGARDDLRGGARRPAPGPAPPIVPSRTRRGARGGPRAFASRARDRRASVEALPRRAAAPKIDATPFGRPVDQDAVFVDVPACCGEPLSAAVT